MAYFLFSRCKTSASTSGSSKLASFLVGSILANIPVEIYTNYVQVSFETIQATFKKANYYRPMRGSGYW
jgi:hypothetical protein